MPSDFLPALGRVPSGIYILTICKGQLATGMLASWVMQAGFEPPMVTVAVRKRRYVADWIHDGQPFVLNLIAAGQKHLLRHFGAGFEPEQPAFSGIHCTVSSSGVPLLADAVSYLECQPRAHVDSADHYIFLAEVTGGAVLSDAAPMVHIRKTGAHY